MQKHPIDSVMKKKLDSFEVSPSDTMWESIDQRISKQLWLKKLAYITATVLILGLLCSLWYHHQTNTVEKKNSDTVNIQSSDSLHLPETSDNSVVNKNTENISTKKYSVTQVKNPEEKPLIQPTINTISQNTVREDTSSISNTPVKKMEDTVSTPKVVVIKKKKPVYIIQKDTIIKTDTIQVKKREK